VVVVDSELTAHRSGADLEKRAGGRSGEIANTARYGQFERRNRKLMLSADMQRHAAGDKEANLARGAHEGCELTGGRSDMFEVVDHDQHALVIERARQTVWNQVGAGANDADRLRDGRQDQVRFGQG